MRLWIRADASPSIGLGHLMRTLACAEEAIGRGIAVEYVMAHEPRINSIPVKYGCSRRILDSPDDQSWIESINPGDVVLFDGYHFGPADFDAAREAGARVGAIDDLGRGEFPSVDVLVNQNLGRPTDYVTGPATRCLLGPRFAMVRSEFRERRRLRGHSADTLVISFGGSDVANLSVRALKIALDSTFRRIVLLVGPAADLEAASLPASEKQVEVVRAPPSVAEVFDQADAVVAGAGSTTWELLCMGLPVVLVEVADNQTGIGQAVARAEAGLFAGTPTELGRRLPSALEELGTIDLRIQISRRCLDTVDGLGACRVLDTLMETAPRTTGAGA